MNAKLKERISSHLLCILLSLAIVITMTPMLSMSVYAGEAVSYMKWDETQKMLVSDTCDSYTTVTSEDTEWASGWYVVDGNITINNTVTCKGAVHLILKDGAKLEVQGTADDGAGINVHGTSNSLAVYGQSGQTGKLTATGSMNGAGIGGGNRESGSNITINGGTVNATGGEGATGIGGGNGGSGSEITINGGTVNATGGEGATGIGGGNRGSGSEITINGGTVTATGGEDATGIGSGKNGTTAANIKASEDLVVQKSTTNSTWETVEHTSETELAGNLARYVKMRPPVAEITVGETTTKYSSVQAAVDAAGATPTNIKMIADSEENVSIAGNQDITLDLNGYVLSGTAEKSVICVDQKDEKYGQLTVKDSNTGSQKHNFKVEESGLWTLTDEDATVNFENLTARPETGTVIAVTGGCITGGNNDGNSCGNGAGGGIENWGILNFKGGNIVGNTTGNGGGIWSQYEAVISGGNIMGNTANNGGGIWSRANLTVSNGNILYNTAIGNTEYEGDGNGGGVCNDCGKLNLSGGTISGNRADANGGGVYNKEAEFNLSGGKISGNTAEIAGGGIYHGSVYTLADPSGDPNGSNYVNLLCGTLIVGGNPVVENNTLTGKTTSNLYIYENTSYDSNYSKDKEHSVEIGTGTGTDVPAPKAGMSIGVTLGTTDGMGQFTTNGTEDDVKYFTSDSLAYKVKFNSTNSYLELADYDINAVTSKTAIVNLEKATMTDAQAIAIAQAQKPYDSLSTSTSIAYAQADDFATTNKYKIIKAKSDTDWATATDMTLADMKSGLGSVAYFVIGTVAEHTHSWTYTLSEDKKTITVTCTDGCDYAGTDTNLTIEAPTSTTYDGTEKKASLGDATTFLGESLPNISYEYKAESSGTYATTTDLIKAGYYRASFTVGEGTRAKTGYVEYKITKSTLTKADFTYSSPTDLTYDGSAKVASVNTESGVEGMGNKTILYSSDNGSTWTATPTNAGDYKVGITVTEGTNYNAVTDVLTDDAWMFTVAKKKLSITGTSAEGKTYDGTITATVTSLGTVSGKVSGDDVTVTIASATFADENAGNSKNVTIEYSVSGAQAANYIAPDDDTTQADIDKATIKVTADDKSSYVGENLKELTYKADALIGDDTFTGGLETDADKNKAGTYEITNKDLSAGVNYTLNFTPGKYIVSAAPAPQPTPEPSNEITVPVSGDKNEVPVKAEIDKNNAKIETVTKEEITQVGTDEAVKIDVSEVKVDGKVQEISEVTLTKETLQNINESEASGLEINLSTATVVIDQDTLKAVIEQAEGNEIHLVVDKDEKAEETLTDAQKETIEDMNQPVVLDAYFVCNGKRISDFQGGKVKLIAEYATDKPVRVWFVSDAGDKEKIKSSFDSEKKVASFDAEHFSHYVIEAIDEDPFVVAETVAKGKTALAVSWTECEGASEYVIYANKCNTKGHRYSVKKIATTDGTSYTIKKLGNKKLKKNTFYKVKVVALDASGKTMATSKIMHAATGGYKGKRGNTVKITAKDAEQVVSVGDTKTVGVKAYKVYKNKKIATNHATKVRFMSSNNNVATVNSKGVVKGIKSGTCTIYMQAPNGLWATTEVTVLQDTNVIIPMYN